MPWGRKQGYPPTLQHSYHSSHPLPTGAQHTFWAKVSCMYTSCRFWNQSLRSLWTPRSGSDRSSDFDSERPFWAPRCRGWRRRWARSRREICHQVWIGPWNLPKLSTPTCSSRRSRSTVSPHCPYQLASTRWQSPWATGSPPESSQVSRTTFDTRICAQWYLSSCRR